MTDVLDKFEQFTSTPHDEVPGWVNDYFTRISRGLERATRFNVVEPIHVEPFRKYDGLIVFADGVDFDPGAGRGLYYWDSQLLAGVGDWVYMGGSRIETALESSSFIDQNPTGLGVDTQITFGSIDSTASWSITAEGAATCLFADSYTVKLKLTVGREGTPGESQIYSRLLINGVQVGDSSHVIIDNQRIEMPIVFESTIDFDIGDVLTFEIIRDTDGNDSGGLRAGIPDVSWANSPSASLLLTRIAMG